MENFLTIQLIILSIAGLINLFMSIFILARSKNNKINKYFACLTFFNFTWSLGLALEHSVKSIDLVSFYDRSTNISGIGIIVSLFYFALHFPYQREEVNKIKTAVIWLLAFLFSILIYTKWFVINTVWIDGGPDFVSHYYKPVFIIYALYFIILAVCSVYFLFKKYKQAEGILKKQLKWLILTITIGLIAGAYLDIFLSYFGNFKPGWLGPIFTLFMNMVVFYFITASKDNINN